MLKEKLDIAFLGGDSSGVLVNEMFQDGLMKHPRVNRKDFETIFPRWGEMPFNPIPKNDIINNIINYDIIFADSERIQGELEALFERLNLWKKVVIYDCKDDQNVRKEYIYKCLVYFKRSWQTQLIPEDAINTCVLPLPYAILYEYYDVIPLDFYPQKHHRTYSPGGRDFGVMCTLPQCYRNVPRDTLAHAVKNYQWGCTTEEHGSHHIQLTLAYTCGALYSSTSVGFRYPRNFSPPDINWWYIYMHFLRRTQILFTAASHSAVCDIRTWEAFSSGALVFIDFVDIPTTHPFEEGKHFIKIDMKDLPKTLEKAKELMSDNTERMRIAQAGFEHGMKYHTPVARMDYVFDEIDKRLK